MSSERASVSCNKCRLEYPGDALFCPNCGTARHRDQSGDPILGTKIGDRYLVQKQLGYGASGTIYLAEHVNLRRKVAVKVLHPELSQDELAIERFRREATTVGEIDNEHIAEIFDFGRAPDGRLYLAMEYLEGETLTDILERDGQLSVERAVNILTQLGEALMEAHAIGYVHRDLRPRNIFITRKRGQDFVKLIDFGLAKLVASEGDAASTSLGMTFGDPHYMSPEQARGDSIDRRADIYSLGCISYEMLTGRPPFEGEKVFDVLTSHLETRPEEPVTRREDIPPWLNRAIVRMLAKHPNHRFITVYRMIQALRQGTDSGVIMTDDVARRVETTPPPSVSQAIAKLSARKATETADGSPGLADTADTERTPVAEGGEGGEGTAVSDREGAPLPDSNTSAISEAWYADGDAMEQESNPDQRTRGRRPGNILSETGLMARDQLDLENRRRWKIAALIGVLLVAGVAGAFALMGGKKSSKGPADSGPAVASSGQPAADAAPVQVLADASASDAGSATVGGASTVEPGDDTKTTDTKTTDTKTTDTKTTDTKTTDTKTTDTKTTDTKTTDTGAIDSSSEDRTKADVFAKLGQRELAAGDYLAAATNFTKARELHPSNVIALVGLGEIALGQGSAKSALTFFRTANNLQPGNAHTLTVMGEAQLALGRRAKAATSFRRALKINPDSVRAREGYLQAEGVQEPPPDGSGTD